MTSDIKICKSASAVRIPRKKLVRLGKIVLRGEGQNRRVTLIFASDNEMKQLNRQFRGKNRTTDVLSFALDEANSGEGEIYISCNEARMNANRYGGTETSEILKLFCHGLLHLCGTHHPNPKARATMERKENYYLQQLEGKTNR